MNASFRLPALPAIVCLTLACACAREAPLTPEQAREKGDAMLRQMSQKLAAMQAFSYRAEQTIEHAATGGQKRTEHFTRLTTVRRPNQLTFVDTGGDRDSAVWYDGKFLTVVMNKDKVWVRGPMPPTLDEAMDYVSAEYAIQLPAADLHYSSPYDALMTADTTGGWVNTEAVDTRTCEHLSYQQAVVDWQIWLNQTNMLPCQILITYKTQEGQPTARIVFTDLNESPAIADTTFAATVPDGYKRIKIMRYATVEDKSVAAEADKENGGSHD
jgi:hypothetical protein